MTQLRFVAIVFVLIVNSDIVYVESASINEAICGCVGNQNNFGGLELCREICSTNKRDTVENSDDLEAQLESIREDIKTLMNKTDANHQMLERIELLLLNKTGQHCENDIDIDECANNPEICKNGGTCRDTPTGYTCICANGWTGDDCSIDFDDCGIVFQCLNAKICRDDVGYYLCYCPFGKSGARCYLEDPCASNPCHTGANCDTSPITGDYVCSCDPGWNGTDCSENINECSESATAVCEHNGMCVDTPGSYRCDCLIGYTGARCETEIDECVSNPCLNSVCLDEIGHYRCVSMKDCLDIRNKTRKHNGVYSISPDGQLPVQVYCDIDGGGWTVIQRRMDNSVNFTRGWDEYVNGFGDLTGNFWLGLKYIHLLTSSPVDILFEVVTKDTNETALMQYTNFYIDGEDNKYTVHLNVTGTYNTVAKQHRFEFLKGFGFHNGKPFATFDRPDPRFCVNSEYGKGGWWYGWCWRFHLNNKFEDMDVKSNGVRGSVTRSEMKIRRIT